MLHETCMEDFNLRFTWNMLTISCPIWNRDAFTSFSQYFSWNCRHTECHFCICVVVNGWKLCDSLKVIFSHSSGKIVPWIHDWLCWHHFAQDKSLSCNWWHRVYLLHQRSSLEILNVGIEFYEMKRRSTVLWKW